MTHNSLAGSDAQRRSVIYRQRILRYIKYANAGHTGGSFSCIDILNVLYNEVLNVSSDNFTDPNRDRYIQSKGHSVEALYVVLADKGFFPDSDLETLCKYQSHYVGHPTRKVNGVEMNTGALGHGLAISVGLALAAKMDQADYRVYTLLGDGELAEGSNWEAAMLASHYELGHLIAIVDRNRLQITDQTEKVCDNEPLGEKFAAFGWRVTEVDGHDFEQLRQALVRPNSRTPHVVIADTIKGKGVSFMENQLKWHHRVPSDEEYELAMSELQAYEQSITQA